eukprot:m.246622 g.246622  ORF g.246622 m.246622 type:complete len:295 (+) comp15116_c0_seq1:30-914(+)
MAPPFTTPYWCCAYAAGAAAGTLACHYAAHEHSLTPLAASFLGDVAATVAIYGFSFAADNGCVYDAYWPIAPIPIAAYWLLSSSNRSLEAYTGLGLLATWAVRYLSIEDPSSKVANEDWRYADIRAKTGRAYWLASLFSLHLTPTATVFLAMSPLYPVISGHAGPLRIDWPYLFPVSAAISAVAIVLQTAADKQLHDFRKTAKSNAILERGVWAYSRHPNYFGEFLFWAGVCGMGLSAGVERWMAAGAAVVFAFFRFASIPLMDARMLARRPQYGATMRRVSAFVPWFRSSHEA